MTVRIENIYIVVKVLLAILLLSCNSENIKKNKISKAISSNFCERLRENDDSEYQILNNIQDMTSLMVASLVVFGEEPIVKTCNCIANKLAKKLAHTYTISELKEIQHDKTKQLILFEKILTNEAMQRQAIECIDATKKHYEEFGNRFDESNR